MAWHPNPNRRNVISVIILHRPLEISSSLIAPVCLELGGGVGVAKLNYSLQNIGFDFKTPECETSPDSLKTLRETRECLGKLSVKQGHPSEGEQGRGEHLVSQSWLVYGPQSLNLCDSNPVPYADCFINNPQVRSGQRI